MAFENLVSILVNYARHGYRNVIVNDLEDPRVQQMPIVLHPHTVVIFTLVVRDDQVLRSRVLDPQRDSGFRDVARALAWNRSVIERAPVEHEFKIDNTTPRPDETVATILRIIHAT